jgi:hypothetical protein
MHSPQRWFLLTIIFLASFNQLVRAQNGTIRGFVYDKETGEPVIFTNVYLNKTSFGAATDANGYFTITRIPDGSYTLMVTYLGFDTLREQVTIKGSTVLTRKLFLEKASYALEGISISAEYQELRTDTRTSVVKVTPSRSGRYLRLAVRLTLRSTCRYFREFLQVTREGSYTSVADHPFKTRCCSTACNL